MPTSGSIKPRISVDLDDVLSHTNQAAAECERRGPTDIYNAYDMAGHNRKYGTRLSLEHFYCKSSRCASDIIMTER